MAQTQQAKSWNQENTQVLLPNVPHTSLNKNFSSPAAKKFLLQTARCSNDFTIELFNPCFNDHSMLVSGELYNCFPHFNFFSNEPCIAKCSFQQTSLKSALITPIFSHDTVKSFDEFLTSIFLFNTSPLSLINFFKSKFSKPVLSSKLSSISIELVSPNGTSNHSPSSVIIISIVLSCPIEFELQSEPDENEIDDDEEEEDNFQSFDMRKHETHLYKFEGSKLVLEFTDEHGITLLKFNGAMKLIEPLLQQQLKQQIEHSSSVINNKEVANLKSLPFNDTSISITFNQAALSHSSKTPNTELLVTVTATCNHTIPFHTFLNAYYNQKVQSSYNQCLSLLHLPSTRESFGVYSLLFNGKMNLKESKIVLTQVNEGSFTLKSMHKSPCLPFKNVTVEQVRFETPIDVIWLTVDSCPVTLSLLQEEWFYCNIELKDCSKFSKFIPPQQKNYCNHSMHDFDEMMHYLFNGIEISNHSIRCIISQDKIKDNKITVKANMSKPITVLVPHANFSACHLPVLLLEFNFNGTWLEPLTAIEPSIDGNVIKALQQNKRSLQQHNNLTWSTICNALNIDTNWLDEVALKNDVVNLRYQVCTFPEIDSVCFAFSGFKNKNTTIRIVAKYYFTNQKQHYCHITIGKEVYWFVTNCNDERSKLQSRMLNMVKTVKPALCNCTIITLIG